MKRSIVALLVVLALIILVSPGIVGRIAENNLEDEIASTGRDNPNIVVTTEKFDRGWFTSEGTHRVSMRHADLQAALSADSSMPSLIIDTRFDHGLVPLSSMSHVSGSLKPGLARMVSTLHIDDGKGNITDLPGAIYSETSLGGDTTGRYILEPGSREEADVTARWAGANLEFAASKGGRDLTLKGAVQPWSFRSETESVEVGLFTVDGQQSDTDFGFPVGKGVATLESLTFSGTAGSPINADKISSDYASSIDGDQLNVRTQMAIEKVTVPAFGDVGIWMDLSVDRVDAAALGRLSKSINEAQGAADPEAAMGQLFSLIQPDLEALLAAGGELRFNRFDLSLPQGQVRSKLGVSFAESAGPFSWPGLILSSKASADFEIPGALVEMGRQMNPETESIIQMGFLQLDGEVYRMRAEFAGGLLTVNGVPMPIPLPGQ